ncbi:hypothetical protein ACF0H5_018809 [Mactra antiquata]
MFIVGLTGGIATGKSTVSQMLKELSCPIIDADLIAREVVEPGTIGWEKIRDEFGADVFHKDGKLDREKLGKIIFADNEKRRKLNQITHPEIQKSMMWKLFYCFLKGYQFAILDTPLLFESKKMLPYMSYTVVVTCSSEQQLTRLQSRNNLTTEEAEQRINAQMSLDEKCRLATYVIDNNGSIEDTKKQVVALYELLCESKKQWKLRIVLFSVFALLGSVMAAFVLKYE